MRDRWLCSSWPPTSRKRSCFCRRPFGAEIACRCVTCCPSQPSPTGKNNGSAGGSCREDRWPEERVAGRPRTPLLFAVVIETERNRFCPGSVDGGDLYPRRRSGPVFAQFGPRRVGQTRLALTSTNAKEARVGPLGRRRGRPRYAFGVRANLPRSVFWNRALLPLVLTSRSIAL
jgi:hypothetical protein